MHASPAKGQPAAQKHGQSSKKAFDYCRFFVVMQYALVFVLVQRESVRSGHFYLALTYTPVFDVQDPRRPQALDIPSTETVSVDAHRHARRILIITGQDPAALDGSLR